MKCNCRSSRNQPCAIEALEERVLASQAPWSPATLDAEAHSGAAMVQSQDRSVSAAGHQVSASNAKAPKPVAVTYDMATFLKTVKPLKHPLAGNAPMVIWTPPPLTGDLLADQQNGTMRTWIDQLASRGIVPDVAIGPGFYVGYTIAFAQTLEQAGLPVNLVFYKSDVFASTVYQNATIFGTYTDPASGQVYKYPCLPLVDPSIGAAWVQQQLAPIQQAGIQVSSVLFDDENIPNPWGTGTYESQKDNPTVAGYYPPGALDSFTNFIQYTYQLRSTLEGQVMGGPVHQMFPNAAVGDFGGYQSSTTVPYVDIGGTAYPPRQLDGTNAMVPNLYNQETALKVPAAGVKIDQKWADGQFFQKWMLTASTAASNRGDSQLYTFVSDAIPQFWSPPQTNYMMSSKSYEEALRHLWLRGVNSMWLFAGGTTLGSPAAAFQMMDESRSVYDGLLAYRNFLSQGTPMNVAPPDSSGTQPIWSGLRLGDQALIRTYAPSGKPGRITIEAFPGVTVKLPATAAGAGFIVNSKGHVRRVKM